MSTAAAIGFVLVAFGGWLLTRLFDSLSSRGLAFGGRCALRLIQIVMPKSERERCTSDYLPHLEVEDPKTQLIEGAWILCKLFAVRAGALDLQRAGLAFAAASAERGFFDAVGRGEAFVDAAREQAMALESVGECQHLICALSYREDDWWPSEEGSAYLAEQRRFLEAGGTIQRVFVIARDATPAERAQTTANVREQVQLGIAASLIDENALRADALLWIQDFVLYDDRLLRTTETVPRSGREGRTAQGTVDPALIPRGRAWFEELRAISLGANDA